MNYQFHDKDTEPQSMRLFLPDYSLDKGICRFKFNITAVYTWYLQISLTSQVIHNTSS